jgi:hypothetical protein
MAFGFPAYHEEMASFTSRDKFVRALEDVLMLRGIIIKSRKPDVIRGKAGLSLWSWGEDIEILIGEGVARIRSSCSFPLQCVDWGKNRRNVEGIRRELQLKEF